MGYLYISIAIVYACASMYCLSLYKCYTSYQCKVDRRLNHSEIQLHNSPWIMIHSLVTRIQRPLSWNHMVPLGLDKPGFQAVPTTSIWSLPVLKISGRDTFKIQAHAQKYGVWKQPLHLNPKLGITTYCVFVKSDCVLVHRQDAYTM